MGDAETLRRRVSELERMVERLSRVVDTGLGREGHSDAKPQIRLAKTSTNNPDIPDPEGGGGMISDYPKTGNTFEIIFVDAEYTEAEGLQTPTTTDRQMKPKAWVHNLSGGYLDDGTIVAVTRLNGQWWCWGVSSAVMVLGNIDAPESTPGAGDGGVIGGSFNAININPINGTFNGTTLDGITNPFSFKGDDGGLMLAVFDADADVWICIQMECPAPAAAAATAGPALTSIPDSELAAALAGASTDKIAYETKTASSANYAAETST